VILKSLWVTATPRGARSLLVRRWTLTSENGLRQGRVAERASVPDGSPHLVALQRGKAVPLDQPIVRWISRRAEPIDRRRGRFQVAAEPPCSRRQPSADCLRCPAGRPIRPMADGVRGTGRGRHSWRSSRPGYRRDNGPHGGPGLARGMDMTGPAVPAAPRLFAG